MGQDYAGYYDKILFSIELRGAVLRYRSFNFIEDTLITPILKSYSYACSYVMPIWVTTTLFSTPIRNPLNNLTIYTDPIFEAAVESVRIGSIGSGVGMMTL